MRKWLIAFVLLLLFGLAAIGGWSVSTIRQSRAQADQYQQWAQDQKILPVKFEVTAPATTPADQALYLSGDSAELGDWDAAGVPLHRDPDGKYRATVDLLSGIPHEFKVTRGTWGTVERGPEGIEIANHSFVGQPNQVVTATVDTWVDGGKSIPGNVTLTGTFRLFKKFESKILGNSRTLIVYLPPDYGLEPDVKYPVLYMQDGQNLFDSSTAFAGVEWQLDENAQSLIVEKKIEPLIIVGIYNTPDRTAEFTPFDKTPTGSAGRGNLYAKFVVEEVKPFIDRTYRTDPDRAHTGIGGASQGGMIALAIAHDYPNIFGTIAVLDPWLRDSAHSLLDAWTDPAWLKGMRIYADMGSAGGNLYPGSSPLADFNALVSQLKTAGLQYGKDFQMQVVQGAQHNESAWQKRVPAMLMFLYGKQ